MRASLRICATVAATGLVSGPAPACDSHCRYNYHYLPRVYVYYAPPPVVVYGPELLQGAHRFEAQQFSFEVTEPRPRL
jgi:hypothetical protein